MAPSPMKLYDSVLVVFIDMSWNKIGVSLGSILL